MAVARQTHVHAEEDGVVAVQRDTIVDPERGIVAEVEKVVAAVDVGDGKVAVMEQNRVRAIRAIPTQTTYGATTPSWTPRVHNSTGCSRYPWKDLDKICVKKPIVWACSVMFLLLGAVIVGLAGPILVPCEPVKKAGVTIVIIGILTILIALIYCTILTNKRGILAVFRYVSIGLLLLVFFSVAVAESVYVFVDKSPEDCSFVTPDDCTCGSSAYTTAMASISYCILVLVSGFCCLHTIASCSEDCCVD